MTEYLEVDLAILLSKARTEASYLPLSTLARVIAETLSSTECLLLANQLTAYADEPTPPEERA